MTDRQTHDAAAPDPRLTVLAGRFPDAERFPQQVWELVAHLDGTLPEEHPFKRLRVQPEGPTAPEVWLLGSSDYSGALAAQLGLPFSFAPFSTTSF